MSKSSRSRSRSPAWSPPPRDTTAPRAGSTTLDDMLYSAGLPSMPSAMTPQVNRRRLQAAAMPSRHLTGLTRPDPRKVRKAHQYASDRLYWPSEWFLPPTPHPSQKNRLQPRLTACMARLVRRQVLFAGGVGGRRGQMFKRKFNNVRC